MAAAARLRSAPRAGLLRRQRRIVSQSVKRVAQRGITPRIVRRRVPRIWHAMTVNLAAVSDVIVPRHFRT